MQGELHRTIPAGETRHGAVSGRHPLPQPEPAVRGCNNHRQTIAHGLPTCAIVQTMHGQMLLLKTCRHQEIDSTIVFVLCMAAKYLPKMSCCPCIQKKTPPKTLLCFCMPTRHLPKMSSCLCIQEKTLLKTLLCFCTLAEHVQKYPYGLCMTAKAFTQMLRYLCMPYACQNKEKEKTGGASGTGICMETKKETNIL